MFFVAQNWTKMRTGIARMSDGYFTASLTSYVMRAKKLT